MKTTIFITLILINSLSLYAEQIEIKAADGFILSANYEAAMQDSKKGVLMLHQCNADKTMYSDLAKSLGKANIHSLALDFRGYGESITDKFSREKMRASAKSKDDYYAQVRKVRSDYWEADVIAAYETLAAKVGSDNISFIGASCGGVESIKLAKKYNPKSFVFFSSGMNDDITTDFNQLSAIPALIIASQGDEYTFKSSNKIFLDAKNTKTRLLSYKGDGHGHPLFKQDTNLENIMVDWFVVNSK